MKKILFTVSALLALAVGISAQEDELDPAICTPSVFQGTQKHQYEIHDAVSLGSAVRIQNDMVMSRSDGMVEGVVTFNPKSKTVKFSNRKFRYDESSLKYTRVEKSSVTSGKGTLLPDGGEVLFQIIEDSRDNSINMIIRWPDYASVRFLAKEKNKDKQ